MKKLIALMCTLALCLSLAPARAAEARRFPDVDPQTEVGCAVQKMAEAGIINGLPDGMFRADGQLSRAEFVKIVNLTFGLRLTDESTSDFTDVPASHWAYGQVRIARKAGYIQGVGENRFLPGGIVTRQEACVMVGRIQNYQNLTGFSVNIKDDVSAWAKTAVENAISCGLFVLPADGNFRATEPITRGEVCVALAQYVTAGSGAGGDISVPGAGGDGNLTGEQREEAQVAGYIHKMLDAYEKIKARIGDYTSSKTVKDNMDLLMSCMQEALDARDGGVFLTRDYIDKTFASEIKRFKSAYGTLSKQEVVEVKTIVASLAYADEIEMVMNYFGVSLNV